MYGGGVDLDMVDMLRIKVVAALVYENILDIPILGQTTQYPTHVSFLDVN